MSVGTPNTRALAFDRIAVDLFFEPRSVSALAAYLVKEHSDARVLHAHDLADTLVDAIIRSEMAMRVVGFRHVPGLESRQLRTVAWCELFYDLPTALPFFYAKNHHMTHFLRAFRDMTAETHAFYYNARNGGIAGELILECFNGGREMAERAWPSLLLTFCFIHYIEDIIEPLMARKEITSSSALTLINHATRTLRDIVTQGPDRANLGRCAHLTVVERSTLFEQLIRLNSLLADISIVSMKNGLYDLAWELAAAAEWNISDMESIVS